MNRQQEQALRVVADNDVRFIRLWFTDVIGKLKAVAIDPSQLEDAFLEGIGFDGSSLEGMVRTFESDMVLIPDARSLQLLPFQPADNQIAAMYCDLYTPEGKPAALDPRGVLERALERAANVGFNVLVHPEIEFYLLQPPATAEHVVPVDSASYFDHVAWGDSNDFRRQAIQALESMNISVEFSHHEGGPGQNEIDLRAVDALRAADNIMTAKTVISEVALRQNMVATFMPKLLGSEPGTGMHLHLSLFEGEENAIYSGASQYQLSRTGRHFIAGILHHARGISAIINQTVNSYKRLWSGGEAPSYICWGHNNRSALVRVPHYKPRKSRSARIEYRASDPVLNPYLALAVLIEAGLDGIANKMELAPDAEDDVWLLSRQERKALGIGELPRDLHEALEEMGRSDMVARVLGEQLFNCLLENGYQEWAEYNHQITKAEYDQFLGRH